MKLAAILAVVLSMFCFAGEAVAQQSVTVEFIGPWSLIHPNNSAQCGGTMNQCIVAVSSSQHHKPATFHGTQLNTGVYTLNLPAPAPDSFNGTKAHFVDGLAANKAAYEKLIQASNPAQDRYVVILPFVPDDSIEQAAGEIVKVTDSFVSPDAPSTGQQDTYAKDIKIHYKVSALSITLSGKLDAGAPDFSKPVPSVSSVLFSVDPLDGTDFSCDHHARQAFQDMNDLLQPTPRKFVDFPGDGQPYDGKCREGDPQDPHGTLASTFTLIDINTKKINASSLQGFMNVLNSSSKTLDLKAKGARQKDIQGLLQKTQDFLQKDAQNDPNHRKTGLALAQNLNQTITVIEKAAGQDVAAKKKEQRTLAGGLGILAEVVQAQAAFGPGGGANCKAPMMSLTVGQ
jgi:hypothetical protein